MFRFPLLWTHQHNESKEKQMNISPEIKKYFGNTGVEGFTEFMQMVENSLISMCGMGVLDLPDYMYMDAFEEGESPQETALDLLENEGFM